MNDRCERKSIFDDPQKKKKERKRNKVQEHPIELFISGGIRVGESNNKNTFRGKSAYILHIFFKARDTFLFNCKAWHFLPETSQTYVKKGFLCLK